MERATFPRIDRHIQAIAADPRFSAAAKRLYDLVFTVGGLVVLSPLFLLIATLVKSADGGPVFYRQIRIGLHGKPFRICKFRTMVPKADQVGPGVTKDGDARITWVGRILRKSKLDELPQLWNVLRGEMSLVGPRPEVPRYVEHYNSEQREILRFKPGITDLASLCFRDEERLLGNVQGLDEFYIHQCIPRKLRLNREYAESANLLSDTWIIVRTLCPYWFGVLATYGLLLALSYWLSYQLIYDFAPAVSTSRFLGELFAVLGLQLGCLMWRKQCTGLLSYFSFPELRQVSVAFGLATIGLLACWATGTAGSPPRNVILVNALVSLSLLSSFRVVLRLSRERSGENEACADRPTRVGIIGAGSRGAKLALELAAKKNLGRTVVAFFDDDFQKWQKHIHGVPVVGMPECLIEGWTEKLDEVVIAIPSAPADRMRDIAQLLRKTKLKSYTAYSPDQLWRQPA